MIGTADDLIRQEIDAFLASESQQSDKVRHLDEQRTAASMSLLFLRPSPSGLDRLPSLAKMAIMVGADALMLPLCMLVAVALRLGQLDAALATSPAAQLFYAWMALPVFVLAGLYRAMVRYVDLRVLAASGAALATVAVLAYVTAMVFRVQVLPRSSLLIFWFVAFAYVVASRFTARAILRRSLRSNGRQRLRTAIYGAGDAGAQLAHAMLFSSEYRAVCFFDDSLERQYKTVVGLRVYSPEMLERAIARHDVAQIVVAIPSASAAQRRRLIERLNTSGLPVKILPGLMDLLSGRAAVSDLREVDVADLLGRDTVEPDPALFSRNVAGKVVLVTGAGGSIGRELCRQALTQHPRKLVLLDHSEFSLYGIDQELTQRGDGIPVVACLGSVLDAALLRDLIRREEVQTIYHAAAYKHVPLVEINVQQGIRNNVFGTLAIARAAQEGGVETCVLVSTDKAVRPTNAMGASKRVAELIFQAAALRSMRTVYSIVRFGNVLDSSGSVVPLFRRQIHMGGPVTITHPEIVRYFMLIPEAAQLVIQAGAMAKGGEVFVLDMGEPVRIADLARTMIRLSGLTEKTAEHPGGDIEIRAIGLRPGEKLYEELLIGGDVQPSGHARIMCARERLVEPSQLDKMLALLQQVCDEGDAAAILRQVRKLVPEFRSAEVVNREPFRPQATKQDQTTVAMK